MNFIKKKLKGHKKDDEEEEYEKAVYEQSLHPQNPDQKMKNTEEWQFFQQLSMKVQDTVQKTQTTLNKLKDTRPEDEDGDFYEDSELQPAEVPPYGTTKVLRAPPRPPPPAGEKSSMPLELDFGSDFSQSSIPKGPPRPPPPKSSEASFGIDSSALPGTSNKSFSSPARPPPPNLHHQVVPDPMADPVIPSSEKVGASFSLLDEFGFQKEPVTTTSNANMQDLLFLDDKEEVDPFDTSFVDVSNIAAVPLTSEKREAGKPTEKSSNPFCSSSTNDWLSSSSHSDKNSKTTTNPFFTGTVEESKPDSLEDQSLSSHNPFSFTQPTQVNNAQDSFFGITIEPTSKDNLNKSLFENNEELIPKSSVEYEFSNEYINTAFSCNEPNINEEMQLDKVEKDIVSSSILSDNTNAIIWDSDIKKEDSDFISDPIMAPEPVLSPEKIPEAPSMAWQGDSSTILQPEIMPSKEFEPSSEDIKRDSNEAMDVLRKSSIATNDSFSNTEQSATPSEVKSIDQVDVSNDITTNYSTTKEAGVELKMDTFSSTSIKDNSNDLLSDTADGFDSRFNETSTDIQDKPQASFTDFSKPFEGEKGGDAFLFKVKSSEEKADLEFDAFAAKFESAKDTQESDAFDPFMSKRAPTLKKIQENFKGFDSMDEFDPFRVSHKEEPPQSMMKKEPSRDSFEDYDNEVDFSVVIKPKLKDSNDVNLSALEPPKLLPPPKTPTKAFESPASRFNPFDKDFLDNTKMAKATEQVIETVEAEDEPVPALGEAGVRKADSVETPLSPLFDEDTSQPLEIFPVPYEKEGWEMVLRQPNKKKLTGNRFWKKIIVKLSENSVLQLFNKADDKLPFQELPLQACYSLSEIGAQQYDQYGKIFTVKLQYKFYRERVGVRPGQISKVTQGQVTSMGDVAKLGLPLQHSAQTSQLLKLGSQFYLDIKFFIQEVEDALFRMTIHRDRVLTYKTEEVQVIAQDEFYVEQSKIGHIDKQLARVRIFFLAFITGMPSVEVGLNDIIRQGKEVVGRYDIIPVVTEEWIRLEDCEFHSCVIQDEFYKNRVIKFHPPDACLFELLRFRIRPPKNRELPLQVRVFMTVTNTRVEIRSDILVPGYSSRKQGQVPCENIQIRFPVPECWIYLFRTEKHFRYGSKKSTARRPGKIKGLERIMGAAQNLDPSLIEVSAGQAKYEHVFHAVVWRIPRLPKEGQGAYTQQLFLLRTELTSFDQIPESFEQFVDVEFTMPATYVSHTTVRSVSVTNPIPPEKYVRYISKHEYKVEIDFKKSTDEIDGLMNTSNVSVPISTTPAVQESTEDEDKDDSD